MNNVYFIRNLSSRISKISSRSFLSPYKENLNQLSLIFSSVYNTRVGPALRFRMSGRRLQTHTKKRYRKKNGPQKL